MNWFGVYPTISKVQELTSGHHIIMGQNIQSFPKPLPNRTHIVISRQDNYKPEGIVVSSMEKAIATCPTDGPIYIIGGGKFII
jgi:dihydrofolate reductase